VTPVRCSQCDWKQEIHGGKVCPWHGHGGDDVGCGCTLVVFAVLALLAIVAVLVNP
jgi:hypothetical protein